VRNPIYFRDISYVGEGIISKIGRCIILKGKIATLKLRKDGIVYTIPRAKWNSA
jgi:hypothetical protein